MAEQSKQLVEHLFRSEYGKLVSILTHTFGTAHIELAEDIVQDTLISALSHWSINGIPTNPTGWLVQVAKRKTINELKRNKKLQAYSEPIMEKDYDHEADPVFLKDEIQDSQLRMIFTCCHPSVNTESQIALILKTLCGFGVKEAASALLTSESTINKRLYRARKSIRESKVPFLIPQGKDLSKRLKTVSLALYLLFNEGYNSSSNESVIQKELCLEAMRLTRLLVHHFDENKELKALLALMCFHTARFDARIDHHGAIIILEDQDRTLWNKELISIGVEYLRHSGNDTTLSAYHIEAAIAAEHCLASSFENTDWASIYLQYSILEKLKPNPLIKLNLAIIQSKLSGIEKSLELLDKLNSIETLRNYYLMPATQGVFHMKLEEFSRAIEYFEKALKLTPSQAEEDFLKDKIKVCKRLLPT